MIRTSLLVVALGAACAVAPAASSAALKAKTSIKTSAGASRVVVVLTSTGAVPARRRPTKVSVKAGARD